MSRSAIQRARSTWTTVVIVSVALLASMLLPAQASAQEVDDEVPIETIEVPERERDFNSWLRFPGTAGEYQDALNMLVEGGVTDPGVLAWDGWDFDELASTDETFSVPVDLESQLDKWRRLEIKNYEFTYSLGCFCPPESTVPVTIRVIDGAIVSATQRSGEPVAARRLITIDDMVDRLSEMSATNGIWRVGASLDVLYGLPRSQYSDPDPLLADAGVGLSIREFSPLVPCGDDWRPFDPVGEQFLDEPDCPPSGGVGDVDCSGSVDIVDALLIALYDAGLAEPVDGCPAPGTLSLNVARGDIDADANTTIIDALLVAQCSVGIDNAYCENILD